MSYRSLFSCEKMTRMLFHSATYNLRLKCHKHLLRATDIKSSTYIPVNNIYTSTGIIYEKLKKEKDGKTLNITIQQVTPDLIEPVVQFMCEHFLVNELVSQQSNLLKDPESVNSFCTYIRGIMKDGNSIAALLEEESDEPKIIAANITGITRKDVPFPELPGEAFNLIFGSVSYLSNEAGIWEKYGVDSYLSGAGLSVHSNYQGMSLAANIFRAREKLCEKLGLSLTVTVFTSLKAQHLAAKEGFETLVEYSYKDFKYIKSDFWKNLDGKINIMAKKFK